MASLIPGYEYDIFISYRQKDNKGDRWVSEFVEALETELESTFKEDISIYFDENPRDGLLETHSVDKSLEDKLRCLVFIPIISQTYCDPKSYAWQHEFCAFTNLAKEDKFGRDVKLSTGNVASRILPVKIHDLDPEDKTLLETELGEVLRSIEFIYMSAGVNRPLRSNEDHPHENLNKTYYRDQINKVANAVKEIINALRKQNQHHGEIIKETSRPVSTPQKSKKTPIIITSVVALALIIVGILFIPKLFKPSEEHEKSIAVLPFKNDSPDQERMYFINGTMEAILDNLCKIKELRVPGRTSVEQYRDNLKPIPVIAKELDVNYILEGSGHRDGNNIRLYVQLLDARKDKHLWSKTYDANIEEIFSMQSEIAKLVAAEIEAVITPEEKVLIERIATTDLTAYELYLKANEYKNNYAKTRNLSSYLNAVNFYKAALGIDSAYAKAYTGLGSLYYDRYYYPNYFKEGFLDSCLILANTALSFDNQLDEAYYLKGEYYYNNGKIEEALVNLDEALKINPNYYSAYYTKGYILTRVENDYVKGLENFHKALNIIQGSARSSLLRSIGYAYIYAGFYDQAKYYFQEALSLNGDSADYFNNLLFVEFSFEKFENYQLLIEKLNKIDTIYLPATEWFSFRGQHQEAYLVAKKRVEQNKKSGRLLLINSHRIGYAYWKMGKEKEARDYFNQQINYGTESIRLSRDIASTKTAQYNLAATYAFLGNKTMAYKYLDEFNTMNFYPKWWLVYLKYDLLFESIHNEERYQKILQNVEAKYQAEHDRVKKWLEKNNMLQKE